MRLTDLQEYISNYESAKYAPQYMGIHWGCDCGCGGDSYTSEQWHQEVIESKEAVQAMKDVCAELGVEYNGIE